MRRISNITKLSQTGDTIVEVLLAIAVVSMVLSGAFVSVNRSLKAGRQSQERGEAMKFAQSQLEQLKQAAKDPSKNIFGTGGPTPYCLNNTLDRVATTDPACNQGPDGRYELSITRDATTGTFTSRVVWNAFQSASQENVSLSYRVYQ